MEMILDTEVFPYCTANHTWFLYGMLCLAEMDQKRVFITADFKVESAKIILWNFCQQDPKFKQKIQSILETAFWESVSCMFSL